MAKQNLLDDCTLCDNNTYDINDQLILKIHDIDDLAIAWISTAENEKIILHNLEEDKNGKTISRENTQWLWRNGGKHGDGEINITQWILNHQNDILENTSEFYLVVAMYDFPYDKFVSAGKWSFDATLEKNSNSVWHKHDFGKSDIKNKIYGLKYLKIFQIKIEEASNEKKNEISISEVIPKSIANKIEDKVKIKHNYTSKKDFIKGKPSKYESPSVDDEDNSLFTKILYSIEILFIISLYTAGIYNKDTILKYFKINLYNDVNLLHYFIIYNILFLLYFFFRYKLGGMAWTLVLKKKHNKELDTFMVVLGLLFSAAFGSITSFNFDAEKINNFFYLLGIFSLYITTNLVLLYILTVISTYTVNTLSANKIMVFVLIFFVGIGIFIQETINFEHNYKSIKKQAYINKVVYNA